MKIIFVIVLFQFMFYYGHASQKIRGVAPEKYSLYDENKPFSCLDGSSVIPFSQVNDDYCDCRDGSDEPGTSACMNSFFACENVGYIVQMIPSSRVNDGICDCCDGSDEYTTNTNCENKCIALANKMKEEEEKLKQLRDQGFIKRKELQELGNELKKSIQVKLEDLESKKINSEAERAKLEQAKLEIEAKANKAKEKQDKIFEERKKELEKLEESRKAKELFDNLDNNKDSFLSPDELIQHKELDILFDNNDELTIEEATKLLDQNEKVSFEVFYLSYYEKISPHLNKESNTKPVEENQEQNQENPEQNQQDQEHDQEIDPDSEEINEATTTPQNTQQNQIPENKYNEETQLLIDKSHEARSEYEKADSVVRDLESEIAELKKQLEYDVGPNGEFITMIGKCFEIEDREYIYKLCPFDKTVQRSKSNSAETTIGYWKGWNEDENKKYNTMKFDNGLACWNGPSRSTLVHVTCGIDNKVISVAEPNRCEYEMKFETPAVCEQHNTSSNIHDINHEEL